MCHYCGCRHVSLIRDYIAEHERVTDLGGDAVRALDVRDWEEARRCIQEMAVLLAAHWQGEENGIFRVMQREEEFADYIAPLIEGAPSVRRTARHRRRQRCHRSATDPCRGYRVA
jgi:hypothetical protein